MKYFLASWKMYPTVDEARTLLDAVQAGLRDRVQSRAVLPRVIVCPPFVSLVPLRALAEDELVRLGAQNCHWEQQGPYTGEISPRMLQGLVDYVMVGHSERRAAGETDDEIARKVAAVDEAGLVPILFVGEDAPDQDAIRLTERRLRHGLSLVDVGTRDVVVVYEPTWAIGAQQAAPPDHVRRAVEHLAGVMNGLGSSSPEFIYGGSVNEANMDALGGLGVLAGVGATRASLRPESFLQIVDWVARAAG